MDMTPQQMPAAFASNLKMLRKNRGLSQEALAHLIGKTKLTVFNWENGKTSPTLFDVRDLCEALEIHQDAFFSEATGGILSASD
jgi:tellurite methyltransferase